MKINSFGRASTWAIALLSTALPLGCGKEPAETPTSGAILVSGSESALPLVREEAQVFMEHYPKASITVRGGSSRAGIAELLEGTANVAVISRELKPDELAAAKEGGFQLESFKIAIDGLAVIVNKRNPVDSLNLPQLADVFSGRIPSWRALGGGNPPIVTITTDPNSGTFEFFKNKVLKGGEYSPKSYHVANDSVVVAGVMDNIGAIGFVSMMIDRESVKTLMISETQSSAPVSLDQGTVLNGDYPLIHPIYMITRQPALGLPGGFVTFVTSAPGQKLVIGKGLVPATMPTRIVRLKEGE
ncbi:MAG: PstS family phosphate ABC transporter substrate-binding protein [Candidatus Eisenbacteria bacterium]|nr:PstS family phosphate ABC transporter substrate-binding protein [Candidatus Eisenbacteria bacterium]